MVSIQSRDPVSLGFGVLCWIWREEARLPSSTKCLGLGDTEHFALRIKRAMAPLTVTPHHVALIIRGFNAFLR
jgi:hypothetical protein